MKRVLLFVGPLLIAIAIFFGILFFLDRKTGKGALQVTSVPQSKVYLDGKLLGSTPLCVCDSPQMLSVGDYVVKLVPIAGGFQTFQEKISINKATLTVVDRTFSDNGNSDGSIIGLSPLSSKQDIEILVISLPNKANVFLDNDLVGVTPLLLKQVSESDHDLRLTLDGYKDKSLKIKTAPGFKLTSLVFLGVNSDLSNTPAASSAANPSPVVAVTKVLILNTPTGFLRVREGNSIYSSEIAQVKPGETYDLVSEKEGWFEIKLNPPAGGGKMGWISSSYAVKQ